MSNHDVKEHNKLVRDLIPEIIVESGSSCEYSIIDEPVAQSEKLNEEDYELYAKRGKLLFEKLKEEGYELYTEMLYEPKSSTRIHEELADIYEVFLALCDLNKVAPSVVVEVADAKRKARGGFERGIYLKTVTTARGN